MSFADLIERVRPRLFRDGAPTPRRSDREVPEGLPPGFEEFSAPPGRPGPRRRRLVPGFH